MRRKALVLALIGALGLVVGASAAGLMAEPGEGVGSTRYLVLMCVYAGMALVFSFLCSIAEAVLLSVSPSYIANLRRGGDPLAERLQGLKSEIDRSLAAILTLNTIAHTVGAGGAGAEAAVYFGEQWVGLAMAVLTLLILFLSEIVPKTLGAVYWRNLAGPTAVFVRGLIKVLYPLIRVSEFLTKLITRDRPVHAFSREEFAALADVGVERGQIEADESRILRNLLRLRELQVKAIMTPRTVIFALQQDSTIEKALEQHPNPSFSRIPIYGTSIDDTRGLVLRIDLMREKLAGRGSLRLRDIMRPAQTTIETVSIGRVFERLLSEKLHFMLVLDEYGGLAGLVTLEDVFETMVGIEIVDESDTIEDLQKQAREEWEKRRRRLERQRDDL